MHTEKRIAFHTLGCKLNFSETSAISRQMEKTGFSKVDFTDSADIYVINTCSVTDNADKECRRIIRNIVRRSPDAHVVVVGCYAQLKPNEIAEIPGVSLVLGAKEKFRLPDYLHLLKEKNSNAEPSGSPPFGGSWRGAGAVYSCDINDVNLFESSYSFGERTRAFLKVQDGCDYSCSYCTIPLARGKSRSDTIAHVVDQAWMLADLGIKEIVISGVNIGDFGISYNENNHEGKRTETLLELIEQLDEVTGISRFRISSIEPNLLRNEIIDFVAQSKRFMPHFHIPLQSGSDSILKLMRRRYRSDLYAHRIETIKELIPHACIGADVIVGFPGEGEKEFLETYNFLNQLPLSYLHVFTYSERTNTEAAEMKNSVAHSVRHRRNEMLRILSEKKRNAFYEEHIGQTRPVLFELPEPDGTNTGLTDNYIKVKATNDHSLRGTITDVLLQHQHNGVLHASHAEQLKEEDVSILVQSC